VSQSVVFAYVVLAGILGSASIFLGVPWIPPLFQATAIFPLFLYFIINRERARAVGVMALWALITTAATIAVTALAPEVAERAVFRGTEYRDEMFLWIDTTVGPESTPSQFIPQHILHYVVFIVVSFVTVGWGGLVMGCVLLNYMNFYVGSLVLEAAQPAMAVAVGWPPYAAIRVIGYIVGAVAVSDLFVTAVLRRNVWEPSVTRRYLGWSLALFLTDIAVKTLTAPLWRRLLADAAGGPLAG
jgi:hypothetical protein